LSPEIDVRIGSVVCVFCAIVDGNSDANRIFSDDVAVGFLDTTPLFAGHVLVVPRVHVATLADLATEVVGPFFERVQRMSVAVVEATGAQGTFVANNNIVSQSVEHLHVHVVPRTKGDGLRGFFWPRHPYDSDQHRDTVAHKVTETYLRLSGDGLRDEPD